MPKVLVVSLQLLPYYKKHLERAKKKAIMYHILKRKMYLFILVNNFQKLSSSLLGVTAAVVTSTSSTKLSLKAIT